jgi:hypothetical protein
MGRYYSTAIRAAGADALRATESGDTAQRRLPGPPLVHDAALGVTSNACEVGPRGEYGVRC